MSKFEIVVAQATGTFPEYMEKKHGAVARAATLAMDDTKDNLLKDGRASIAAAGFPVGMQKALRGLRFPRGDKTSIDAAAFVWHRSLYAGLFEDGGEVAGKPLLWLPMSSTIPKLGKTRVTPSLLAEKGIDLISLHSKSGIPLLGAYISVRTKKEKSNFSGQSVSWAQLKRGRTGKGPFATVPLFHGVRDVHISKKWNVRAAGEKAQQALPGLFANHFKDDA